MGGWTTRVANDVGQMAIIPQPLLEFRDSGRRLRMEKDQRLEILGLLPEGRKPGAESSSPLMLPPIAAPCSPSFFVPSFELFGRQIGILQRHRRISHKPVRVRSAQLCQFLVLKLDKLLGRVAFDRAPKGINASQTYLKFSDQAT
jgi:hypothetical protein